jgi:ferredoxin
MPAGEEEGRSVRIEFVAGRCQGHARCASLAPELFDLDLEGYSFARPGRERVAVGDPLYEKAVLALENCPEEAIRLEPDA